MRTKSLKLFLFVILISCADDKTTDDKPKIPLPEIHLDYIYDITANSAGASCNAQSAYTVNARGVCWSKNSNPTINDNKSVDGGGAGGFNSLLTNLDQNTKYYVRAYATNETGTAYSTEDSFTTQALPTLTTIAITDITFSKAISGGNITNDGGNPITERGLVASTTTNPTVVSTIKINIGTGTGNFSSVLTELQGNTKYYVRAFATTIAGTGYGQELSFTTSNTLALGDTFAGGLIFYLDNSGQHGLVVTPNEIHPGLPWAKSGSSGVTGATGTAVGTGQDNTNKIKTFMGTGTVTNPYAAWTCDQLELNGFSDWFMPSKDEVNLMYKNLHRYGCPIDTSPCPTALGNFKSQFYDPYFMWTSTEANSGSAWIQYFNNGTQQAVAKSGGFGVPFRAVRVF